MRSQRVGPTEGPSEYTHTPVLLDSPRELLCKAGIQASLGFLTGDSLSVDLSRDPGLCIFSPLPSQL